MEGSNSIKSPLFSAIEKDDIEMVKLLLDNGASIEQMLFPGDTALSLEANLHNGSYQRSPLHLAVHHDYVEIVRFLLDNDTDIAATSPVTGDSVLHVAASTAGKTIPLLVERGAAVMARTKGGETPLHYAAGRDGLASASLFIDVGAIVDAIDDLGWTAAHRAAWDANQEILDLLKARGADLSLVTTEGFTIEALLEGGQKKKKVYQGYTRFHKPTSLDS